MEKVKGNSIKKKPEWLKIRVRRTSELIEVENMLKRLSLNTVCDEANCPNRMECFGRKTATFMILGKVCTRNCTFCNVEKKAPQQVDDSEPEHVAMAVKELGLKHVVVTSVTRDDLDDGGAGHFARVIEKIKTANSHTVIEVLVPDFKGSQKALEMVASAKPHIINHNVETVPRLYPKVRPMADYKRSLKLLQNVRTMDKSIYTKSGIMLGLGEKKEEVLSLFMDLRAVGCDFITVGQYLAPSKNHHPVIEYIHPDVFGFYKSEAEKMGFAYVASAPFVRSSYQAELAMRGENQIIEAKDQAF